MEEQYYNLSMKRPENAQEAKGNCLMQAKWDTGKFANRQPLTPQQKKKCDGPWVLFEGRWTNNPPSMEGHQGVNKENENCQGILVPQLRAVRDFERPYTECLESTGGGAPECLKEKHYMVKFKKGQKISALGFGGSGNSLSYDIPFMDPTTGKTGQITRIPYLAFLHERNHCISNQTGPKLQKTIRGYSQMNKLEVRPADDYTPVIFDEGWPPPKPQTAGVGGKTNVLKWLLVGAIIYFVIKSREK